MGVIIFVEIEREREREREIDLKHFAPTFFFCYFCGGGVQGI